MGRVLEGEKVPAGEEVVSLFEPHTDIIIKGGRRVQFGHKLNLAAGPSGLVLDAVVEPGNPADSSRCVPMIARHAANFGSPPEQVAFDGGYASRANLAVFHKGKGLGVAVADAGGGLRNISLGTARNDGLPLVAGRLPSRLAACLEDGEGDGVAPCRAPLFPLPVPLGDRRSSILGHPTGP